MIELVYWAMGAIALIVGCSFFMFLGDTDIGTGLMKGVIAIAVIAVFIGAAMFRIIQVVSW